MGLGKILGGKGMQAMLIDMAKKAFKEDGLELIAIRLDEKGEVSIDQYKKPMVIISLEDKIKYDNMVLKVINNEKGDI